MESLSTISTELVNNFPYYSGLTIVYEKVPGARPVDNPHFPEQYPVSSFPIIRI
jgi:hypothetical protein